VSARAGFVIIVGAIAVACVRPAAPPGLRFAALDICPADAVDRKDVPSLPTTAPPPPRTPPAMCTAGTCLWQASDRVYDVTVPRAESWWVHEGFIYRGKERVRLRGVNWFGFETNDVALHGLWARRTVADFLDQMTELGFDAIRLPLSPEAFRPGFRLPEWAVSPGITTSDALLADLLVEADKRDIHVLLDMHTCGHGFEPQPGSPQGCGGYTISSWLDDLRILAALADEHPNVIGIDLFNEPFDLLWGEWADLASRGARAVLEVNPRILVFVQGASWRSAGAAYDTVLGESLVHAVAYPPDIPASRLVYAPHAYGPDVYVANYLSSSQYPAVLQHVWDLRIGRAFAAGYGLAIGEFGGHYDDTIVEGGVAWQDRFVAWMRARGIDSFFYWSWNPNSVDTGGILKDDWKTPVDAKLRLLAPLLAD